jgi:hypothetical protein
MSRNSCSAWVWLVVAAGLSPVRLLREAQAAEGPGLALLVVAHLCSGNRGLAECDSFVPVAFCVKEVAYRGGNSEGVTNTRMGCGIVDAGVHRADPPWPLRRQPPRHQQTS